MSHELRTPLNGILGFAHLLQRAELPAKAGEQARRIAEQGNHLLGLVNEIMDFTRLESLRPPERPGTLEPGALLSGLAEELRSAGEGKGLRVVIDLAPELPAQVAGEGDWLRGCLRPLLDNAVKFTERGEVGLRVRIEAGGEGTIRLRVTVSDQGIGIAESDHAKLFQPFRQVDATTTRRHGGLGLGLAISARYAGLLGATLTFDSAPGAGSQFHLDWLTRIGATSAIAAPVAAGDPDEQLTELERLLREDDLRAASVLHGALPGLAQIRDGDLLEQLKRQVESFDYPAALGTLAKLRKGE